MKKIPLPTKRRLIQLASLLSCQGVKKITSKDIQALTGWTDSVIRRDISLLGYKGGVSNGYSVQDLYEAINKELGIGNFYLEKKKCCVVGLENFGSTMLENNIFKNTPFEVIAGFDSNVNRIEILHSSFPLYHTSKMEEVIHSMGVEYALLFVSEKDAQKMVERLCKCGIRGIVNYTTSVLSVTNNVVVENISPITALENLVASVNMQK